MLLTAGSLLHRADSPFGIRGMFVGSSNIDVGAPGHHFDHLFKWCKFAKYFGSQQSMLIAKLHHLNK